MARPLRIQFDGAVYHLMASANYRLALFRDNRDRRSYLALLRRYRDQFGLRIYAYLLGKSRVDLVLETSRPNVSRFMQCLGTSYAYYYNCRHKRTGYLFGGRFRSYLLDKERSLAEATRFVHLKADGKRRGDRAWSSYPIYLGRASSDLIDPRPILTHFGETAPERRRRYREFVEDKKRGGTSYPKLRPEDAYGFSGDVRKAFAHVNNEVAAEDFGLERARAILRKLGLALYPDGASGLIRRRKDAPVRQVAMYLMRRDTDLPLRSIGELMGVKAAAVAQAIGRAEELMSSGKLPAKLKNALRAPLPSSSDRDLLSSSGGLVHAGKSIGGAERASVVPASDEAEKRARG